MKEAKIVGGFEEVGFPDLNVKATIAKIDTGAYSGALHATQITEKKDEDGKYLEFHPLGKKSLKASCRKYRLKSIKSSNGELEERYVINTKIILQGQSYPVSISLSDRSNMMKSVLIGRQFLRRHHFVVDVRLGKKYAFAVKDKN